MTVAQELVKEPCKSNPKGLKCTKKLRRVLQSEMKDIPAIQRRAAINKRLKEIKSSSTTVVRGKARRKLKRSYAGNLPLPRTGQVRGAVAPAANPAAPPISQPFGQLRPDFERANTDRLNAAANAGDRVQSAYYAQQLGLTPSIRNNALNPAALALFPPATTNFQAQPLAPGAGVPALPAPTIASTNAANQARLRQAQLPPAAPVAPAAAALYPGEDDESKGQDPRPRPTLVDPNRIYGLGSGTPPRGSVNTLGTGGSAPLTAQSMRGVSTVQPGDQLTLTNRRQQAEQRRLEFSGGVGDYHDTDLLTRRRTRTKTEKGAAYLRSLGKRVFNSPRPGAVGAATTKGVTTPRGKGSKSKVTPK